MAYVLSDIATRAATRARDTGYSPTEAKAFVNDTQNAVANEYLLRFWEKATPQSYTLTVDVADITNGGGLPADFVLPISLRITTTGYQRVLTPVNFTDFEADNPAWDSDSSGTPDNYYFVANTISVHRKPDIAHTLKMRYQRRPTQLSADAAVPEIPSEFEELLIYGAAERMFIEKDMDSKAATMHGLYELEVAKLVNRYGNDYVGQVHYINTPRLRGRDNRGAWD